ncbi:hypothetical protein [Robiginitalea sp. IMCC43444]|uniref:hypothetical protein n=1 Tax=Robiginitalea sp. IMCC43444 TaxID=3459121 RepID=UPI00404231AC
MKTFQTIFLLLGGLQAFSQINEAVGDYSLQMGSKDSHFIEYQLSLNADSTFLFYAYTESKISEPKAAHQYGKGKWEFRDKQVAFLTKPEADLNEKFTLDLGNSRAHFISQSPRVITARPVKTRLKFFESKVFWIKGIEMKKE